MADNYQMMYRGINEQFRSAQWDRLSYESRKAACQQLENCLAAERNSRPRQIVSVKMEGETFGYQYGNRIFINDYILKNNAFMTKNGLSQIPACGWQTYDTICHEDLHGMMEDMKAGQTFTYISAAKNYDIYRIQYDEKYAFAVGQDRTLTAILDEMKIHGLEADMIDYKNAAKEDRYQDRVAFAEQHFGIPDITRELDQLVSDKENGIVPATPSSGYLKLDNMLYGAHHIIEEDEAEGCPSSAGTTQHNMLSFGSLFEESESSSHLPQYESQCLFDNQQTQSTTTGKDYGEEESLGRFR